MRRVLDGKLSRVQEDESRGERESSIDESKIFYSYGNFQFMSCYLFNNYDILNLSMIFF